MPTKDSNYKTSFGQIPSRLDVKIRSTPEDVLPYDKDNLYPQRTERLIGSSATAKAVAELFCKFLSGEGFASPGLNEEIIDKKGTTLRELHKNVAKDSKFGGFALHVNYNVFLKAVEIRHVPFKFVRQWDDKTKEHEGQYAIYDDWERVKSKRIEKKNILWVDKFTTDRVEITKQILRATDEDGNQTGKFEHWNGHLFYYPEDYPLSPLDSAMYDIETDLELSLTRNANALTGFQENYVIISKKKLEDEEERQIDKDINALQGGRNAGKVARISGIGQDNEFTFEKMESADAGGLQEKTEIAAQKNIRKTVLAPPELVGEEYSDGFSTDRIEQARRYYNSITEDDRQELSMQYKKVFSVFERQLSDDWTIKPLYEEELDGSVNNEE